MSRLSSSGSARSIPKNNRSLTGRVSFGGADESQPFESSLERDLLQVVSFDQEVTRALSQPVKIDFEGGRHYYPDLLVEYENFKPVLFEVKFRQELKDSWDVLKPKFKAAIAFARERGMIFRVITEQEIRGNALVENVRFLRGYMDIPVELGVKKSLIETLRVLGPCATPKVLLETAFDSKEWRLKGLKCLWFLIANQQVKSDLFKKLTMTSSIWINERSVCQIPLSYRLRLAR